MPAKSPKAHVTPAVLVWARESARLNLETAAKAAGTTVARLAAWESGEDKPSMRQLRLLANKYKRPTALFYLPEPPTDFQPLKDYRRLPGVVAGDMSPRLALEIRLAQERREAALELFEELGDQPPELKIPKLKRTNPERFGAAVRKAIGLVISEQSTWGNGDAGFKALRSRLEDTGVLVFQTSRVERSEARGFAVAHDVLPIIAVNNADAPNAQTFSLAHETMHLALRESALTDFRTGNEEEGRPPEAREIEVFCNAAAAAFLMPAEAFRNHAKVRGQTDPEAWTDEAIDAIARDFCVSAQATVRRMLTLELTTPVFYRQKTAELQLRTEAWLTSKQEQNRKSKGGPPPFRLTLATMGTTFARVVIQTYYAGRITLADATGYLNVRAPQFAKLEQAAFAPRPRA